MSRLTGTLAAANLVKYHGAQPVLQDVTLVVASGARVGLVGANGAGKSTLLRLLAGLDEPDSGTIRRSPPELAVGYLPQEGDALEGELLFAYLARRTGVGAAERELDDLAGRLGSEPDLVLAHADALDRFLRLGGEDLAARAAAVCGEIGLNLPLDSELGRVSGGELARAQLAAILLARFDVYLLDEPTNDLDFGGLERLERFVRELPGAAVVVSHDRDFLDRTVTRVVELDEWTHGATEFAGNWAEFEASREAALRRQYEVYSTYTGEKARLEQQLMRMQRWEERGYGQGRKKKKTKDVKSAIGGRIDRLEHAEKPYEPWELRMTLTSVRRGGDVIARLEGAVVERGSFRLGPINLELAWGDRLALVGANGSGKTTLLEVLLGRIPLSEGTRSVGPGTVLGELDQRRQGLSGGRLLDTFVATSSLAPEDARTLLAKFGLGAEDVRRQISSLSPGERTRALLALLSVRGVNCLVLDEPTNHLDVPAIEELERALAGFDGTAVLVSHDRRFLERFAATRTLELSPIRAPVARAFRR